MRWSPQQDSALKSVDEWLKDPDSPQVFRMFGYAGTGKTTLAVHLAQGVGGEVMFGAFTGKAAYVMQTKGCVGASTIHSMIYRSRNKSDSDLVKLERDLAELRAEFPDGHPRIRDLEENIFREKNNLKRPAFTLNIDSSVKYANLVIIDECSMVDDKMGKDLLSFGTKVLVLGDPAQLPPVGGAGFFTEDVNPEVMLTEVHRQARDSPIIEMATKVRNQIPLSVGSYGENCEVKSKTRIDPELVFEFDQILVGRNLTRNASNRRYRSLQGVHDPYPRDGDKIVCLRNNHDEALLNGAMFRVDRIEDISDGKIMMDISPESGSAIQEVIAHEHHFLGKADELEWYEKKDANEFDFGYALTVHKSQGSQWNKVLLFDESGVFRNDKWRWLYTGITRAAEAVTLVKM